MQEEKVDICYLMPKERLGFRKYPSLHELEERHGVDLGFVYKTDVSTQTFTHYIVEGQHQSFLGMFSDLKFYSFHMDVSADAVNVELELVLVQFTTQDDAAQKMRSYLSKK